MDEHRRSAGPWFRRHPGAAGLVAFVLLVSVTVLRFSGGDEREATALLFVLPVALLALAFGQAAGAAAAIGAVAVLGSWVVVTGTELSLVGGAARVLPLVLLGVLVGRASDKLAAAEALQVRLAVVEARRRDAAEVQDGIVQRLAVAKWSVEGGQTELAIDALREAMEIGEALVGSLLEGVDSPRRARSGSSVAPEGTKVPGPVLP